jgi:hypothetical protein
LPTIFHFTSPLDKPHQPTHVFRAMAGPTAKSIKAFATSSTWCPMATRVFVTYEGTSTEGRRFRNTEILTIRGQQIVDAEVYFGWSIPHKAEEGWL